MWKTLWKKSLCPDVGEVRLSHIALSGVVYLSSLFVADSKSVQIFFIAYPLAARQSKMFLVIYSKSEIFVLCPQ